MPLWKTLHKAGVGNRTHLNLSLPTDTGQAFPPMSTRNRLSSLSIADTYLQVHAEHLFNDTDVSGPLLNVNLLC